MLTSAAEAMSKVTRLPRNTISFQGAATAAERCQNTTSNSA